jgi:hypothetical protein
VQADKIVPAFDGCVTREGHASIRPAADPNHEKGSRRRHDAVPFEYSTPAVKAYFAECILKAAAQGHTSYSALIAAAADQMGVIASLLC